MINFIGGFFLCDPEIIIDNVIVMNLAILLHAATPGFSVKISVNITDLIQNDLVIIFDYQSLLLIIINYH